MKIKSKVKVFIIKSLAKYVKQTYTHGYKFVAMEKLTWLEKVIWKIVILMTILITAALIISTYVSFINAATATSRLPTRVPVSKVPFPAVGICSGNRMSHSALTKLSKTIYNNQKNSVVKLGSSSNEIYIKLRELGNFFTMEEPDFFITDTIHTALIEIYEGPYPVRDILSNLTVPCSKLLLDCTLMGKPIKCSDIFDTRRTYMGECCFFNYYRPESLGTPITSKIKKDFYMPSAGLKYGLTVVLEEDIDDFAYKIFSSISSKVYIFQSPNFPDLLTGEVIESYVPPGYEASIAIRPVLYTASPELKSFTPGARKCVLPEEQESFLTKGYTFGECILKCRLDDVFSYCSCTPPTHPSYDDREYCSINDLPCLAKWKSKWMNFVPFTLNISRLPELNQCPQCFPACEYIDYNVKVSWTQIKLSTGPNTQR